SGTFAIAQHEQRHACPCRESATRSGPMNRLQGWVALLALCGSKLAAATPIACMPNSNPPCMTPFPIEFSGTGIPSDIGIVRFSSPAVVRLGLVADNIKDIIVGTTTGYVVAYHGDGTFLWARKT